MEKKYQVFVSSTYTDLVDERQKVVEAILNAGHIPAGMELFKAGPKQEVIIREWIEASDIYVLILGPRYGSMNEKENVSYTQWEYNLAKELGKPMFSLVLTDNYIQSMVDEKRIAAKELEISNPLYQKFKEEVMDSLVVQIDHHAEIRSGISDSIRDIERRLPDKLEGWIKGSLLNELEELRKSKEKLSEDLLSSKTSVIEMQGELHEIKVKDDFIGPFKFSAVKDILISDFPKNTKIEKTQKEIKEKLRGIEGIKYNSINYKGELEYVNKLKELNLSSLAMLMNVKSQLSINGIVDSLSPGQKLFNEIYLSKWIELSLVELKKGSGGKKYILSNSGKKFVSMIEMEKLNKNI